MMKTFAIIAALVIAAIAIFLYYSGVFDRVSLEEKTVGPYVLVYRENRGPYQGIRYVLKRVYEYIRSEHKMNPDTGFAIFYDDPRVTENDSLRSIGGVVVDTLISVSEPYKVGVFNETKAIVGTFPIRSFFSYMTGVYSFYNSLNDYLEEHQIEEVGPVMELYTTKEKKIIYIAPLSKLIIDTKPTEPSPPDENMGTSDTVPEIPEESGK